MHATPDSACVACFPRVWYNPLKNLFIMLKCTSEHFLNPIVCVRFYTQSLPCLRKGCELVSGPDISYEGRTESHEQQFFVT